jgi:hypothetical protein
MPAERHEMRIDLESLTGRHLQAYWFNPRTGEATFLGLFKRSGSRIITAPTEEDWVLVIDDAAKRYGPPGGCAM